MPIASVAALLQQLDQYALIDPEHRSELQQIGQRFDKDLRGFARELIQRGWLTPFQINQLIQDNGSALVVGTYVILERLGSGGMGNVFKARHRKLGRIVALKVIHRDKLDNPAVTKRFLREIQVAAKLDHPNIVHAYDAEEVNGARVLVMEHLDGADLGKLVKENGPLPVREACDYIRQAALALQHAHEKGLVHRDVKPSNLLLQTTGSQVGVTGTIKMLDLGLALLQQPIFDNSMSGQLTVAGKVVGSIDFIAPEQARDASSVDLRADLYSLGCTLYFLLTGRPPFEGATVTNKLFKHALEEPEPVEQLRPEVPPTVGAILRRLMAKRPQDRYQTAGEVAAVLDDVLRGRPAPSPSTVIETRQPQDERPIEPAKAVAVPVAAFPRTRVPDRRRWLWLNLSLLGVLLLALAVLVLVLASLNRSTQPTLKEDKLSPEERQAQNLLDRLRQEYKDNSSDKKHIREELIAFRLRYPNLPQTLQAMAFLRELPSPLDDLDPEQIPKPLLFQNAPPELVRVLPGRVTEVKTAPDGPRVLTTNGDKVVQYSDLVTGAIVRSFENVSTAVTAIALSSDGGRALLGGANNQLGLWNVSIGRLERPLDVPATGVTALTLSSDGNWGLGGGNDKVVRLWDLRDRTAFSMDGHTAAVTAVAFSPDGKLAITAGADKTLRDWDLDIRRERKPTAETSAALTSLVVTPDGKQVYTGSSSGVQRWTLGTLTADGWLEGYPGPVTSLAVTADGRYLAAGDKGGWVGIWDLQSGQKVKEWSLPSALGLAWAFDGRHLVVAGGNGGLYVLRLPS